jgi:hypothetical protein
MKFSKVLMVGLLFAAGSLFGAGLSTRDLTKFNRWANQEDASTWSQAQVTSMLNDIDAKMEGNKGTLNPLRKKIVRRWETEVSRKKLADDAKIITPKEEDAKIKTANLIEKESAAHKESLAIVDAIITNLKNGIWESENLTDSLQKSIKNLSVSLKHPYSMILASFFDLTDLNSEEFNKDLALAKNRIQELAYAPYKADLESRIKTIEDLAKIRFEQIVKTYLTQIIDKKNEYKPLSAEQEANLEALKDNSLTQEILATSRLLTEFHRLKNLENQTRDSFSDAAFSASRPTLSKLTEQSLKDTIDKARTKLKEDLYKEELASKGLLKKK